MALNDQHYKKMEEAIYSTSVIKDSMALQNNFETTNGQIPLHLDNEIKQLLSILRPILSSDSYSTNTIILGNSGVGKTFITKHVLKWFIKEAKKHEKNIFAEYFDCAGFHTVSAIYRILSRNRNIMTSKGHGFSDDEIISDFLFHNKKNNQYTVIILDEAHLLPEKELFSILNLATTYGMAYSNFSVICISREYDWKIRESEKISSRIQNTILMHKYTQNELKTIIDDKITKALKHDIFTPEGHASITEFAEKIQSVRNLIYLIKDCALYCDNHNVETVPNDMIKTLIRDVHPDFRSEIIDRLKKQEKAVLLSVVNGIIENINKKSNNSKNNDEILMADAYNHYLKICNDREIRANVIMCYRKIIRNLYEKRVIDIIKIYPEEKRKMGVHSLIKVPAESVNILQEILNKIV